LAAEAALAQADIVLHVTNQTGLVGETERKVLSRVRAKQPIVIALQNVFVPSSASKKIQWLAVLEKQLADIGVHTWRLGSGSRALTINALRLAEATTTSIGNGINRKQRESHDQLATQLKESGLEPLIDFLTGSDVHGLSATELCAVRHASESWAAHRRATASSLLQTFAKSCSRAT
jgi:GTPase Era involved in 16S rRNA processing